MLFHYYWHLGTVVLYNSLHLFAHIHSLIKYAIASGDIALESKASDAVHPTALKNTIPDQYEVAGRMWSIQAASLENHAKDSKKEFGVFFNYIL